MAVALGLAGLSLVHSWYLLSFIAICIYIAFFQTSAGAVIWLYAAEISVDSASGLAIAINFVCLTQISLTMEFMMGGKWGAHGALWWYASINLIGFLFNLCMLRETKGMTDL